MPIYDASGCGCAEEKWYGYDDHGRMVWHTGVVEDSTLSYTYDDFDQLAGAEYPKDPANWASRAELDYTYDLLGRMETVDDGAAADPLARYRYNMASEITDVTYANGARVKYRYDAAGQVAAVTNYAESGTVMSLFQYSYNADGLRTRADREDGSYLTYEYDTLNRLTKEEKKNSGGTVLWRNRFGYDVVGNRTTWHKFVTSSTKTYTYAYNTLNQLTRYDDGTLAHEFNYDLNGNRILEEVYWGITLTGKRHFKWDQDDHLIQVRGENAQGDTTTTWVFRYCRTCSGNRTERIKYTGDPVNEVIVSWIRYEMEGLNHLRIDERYDSPGDANSVINDNDPWRVQRVYYNGPGQLGQIVKATVWDYTSTPTATDYYYGYDILGNVSVISNNSGAEVDQFEQDAFGNEVEGSWSSPAGGITEHLTTKHYDADLGLYYFNARWYDSAAVSFLSRDPLFHRLMEDDGSRTQSCCGLTLGMGKSQLVAALAMASERSPYDYCADNPLTHVDPSGEWYTIPQCWDFYQYCLWMCESNYQERIAAGWSPWAAFSLKAACFTGCAAEFIWCVVDNPYVCVGIVVIGAVTYVAVTGGTGVVTLYPLAVAAI